MKVEGASLDGSVLETFSRNPEMVKRKTRSWIVNSEEVQLDMEMVGIAGKVKVGVLRTL